MKYLFIILSLFLFNSHVHSQSSASNGLLAYFSFDGNVTNDVDKKEYSINSSKNLQFTEDRFGNNNSSLLQTAENYGSNGIEIPIDFQELIKNNEITFSVWFKGDVGWPFSLEPKSNSPETLSWFYLSPRDQHLTTNLLIQNKNVFVFSNPTGLNYSLSDGQWHFLVYQLTETAEFALIDNFPILNKSLNKFSLNAFEKLTTLKIGAHGNRGGVIDDLMIFNRKLKPEEVYNLFHSKPSIGELPPFKTKDTEYRSYFKYSYKKTLLYFLNTKDFKSFREETKKESFFLDYLDENDLRFIVKNSDINYFQNTKIFNELVAIKAKIIEEDISEKQELKRIQDIETKRISYIKKATVGDMLVYTQDWEHNESYLFGFYKKNTPFKMIIKCFIERIEGEKYQVRIADVSSNSENYATPEIKGVKIHRGDIIWAKPFQDKNWFWGEDE